MPASYSCRSTATVSSHLRLGLPSCFLGLRLPSQNLCELVLSPYVTYPDHFSLRDLITWTEFVEELRSWNSSHYSLFQSLFNPLRSSKRINNLYVCEPLIHRAPGSGGLRWHYICHCLTSCKSTTEPKSSNTAPDDIAYVCIPKALCPMFPNDQSIWSSRHDIPSYFYIMCRETSLNTNFWGVYTTYTDSYISSSL